MKKDYSEEKEIIRHPLADVVLVDPDFVVINRHKYRLIKEYRDALDLELLKKKFDPYLEKYDFIVGDVSSEKLRLKGFYRSDSEKINIDKRYALVDDYLQEYLNPGVAYFILESLEVKKSKNFGRKNTRKNFDQRNVKSPSFKNKQVEKKTNSPKHQQGFVIKKRKTSDA